MFPRSLFLAPAFLLTAALAAPSQAAPCQLEITVTCEAGFSGTTSCSSETKNVGQSCSGEFYTGWLADAESGVAVTSPENSLGLQECIDFSDIPEGEAFPFAFCYGNASLGAGQSFRSTTTITGATADIPVIGFTIVTDPTTGDELGSAIAFANVTVATCTPIVSAPPVALSGAAYTVSWTPVSDPYTQYIVEEAVSVDFTSGLSSRTLSGTTTTFSHQTSTAQIYYYRVRPTTCQGGSPTSSAIVSTVVQPPIAPVTRNAELTLPLGSAAPIQIPLFVPGNASNALATTNFNASVDKSFLGISPASGTIPPEGRTLTITVRPAELPAGANTGTVRIDTTTTFTNSAGRKITTNATPTNIPVSLSLVTPVFPGSKSVPPANALIIPVVTHVQGASALFLSDVRLTNAGSAPVKYQVSFAPTQTDARTTSKVTQVTVSGQQTVALNDIAKNFFGIGATGGAADFGSGSLEIRPLNTSSNLTYASSRTYATTANGTFGQFVAAMPFARFATNRFSGLPGEVPRTTPPVLSFQQIAQSSKFRTNLGLVEGAGEPASGRIRILNVAGLLLKEVPFSLKPGEQQQLNAFLTNNGITLDDGRIEIVVDSPTGAVSGYASVLDNKTTDPLAVMPVDVSTISATRYVLPGMAELPNRTNNFHSDLRIYNGGASDVVANFTFFPQGNAAQKTTAPRTIRKGEVLVVDNVLPTLFNDNLNGGSVVVTTAQPSSLVVTGRTYTNVDGGGTYGQFIPGVTPDEGVGRNDGPLQVLQLEQSDGFRSNLGLAELSGQSADVRISLILPDSKTTPSTTLTLQPNEFRQINQVIDGFVGQGKQTFNARIAVQVIGGNGRVTSYGSVIDNRSSDPTYVPAQ